MATEQSWRAIWWNLGRLAGGHAGIIFILGQSHIFLPLLHFSLGIFSFELDICAAWIFSCSTCVFRLFFFFFFKIFFQTSVCRFSKLYNLFFFSHQQNYRLDIKINIYIYIYISVIFSRRPKTMCISFVCRIYEGFHINLWECLMYSYCYCCVLVCERL